MLVILFQVYSIIKLSTLQNTTTMSYENSVREREIDNNLTKVYLVFSDLVVNRNFYDFDNNIKEIKEKFESDMVFLMKRAVSED